MHRTTVMMPQELKRQAAQQARLQNMSLGECVRRALEAAVRQNGKARRGKALCCATVRCSRAELRVIGLLDTMFTSTAGGIFVDTWLSRKRAGREANHGTAAAAWQKIGRPLSRPIMLSTRHSRCSRERGSYVFALEKADSILASSALEILCSTREDELDVLARLLRSQFHRLRFVLPDETPLPRLSVHNRTATSHWGGAFYHEDDAAPAGRELRNLLHSPGADAGCAHADAAACAVHQRAHRLQVEIPASLG
jgi:hypothetical protein